MVLCGRKGRVSGWAWGAKSQPSAGAAGGDTEPGFCRVFLSADLLVSLGVRERVSKAVFNGHLI